MKSILLISALSIFSFSSFGQKVEIPTCTDAYVHAELVRANSLHEKNNFSIHTTKNLLMLNGGLQPVTIEVKRGKEYIVNFAPNVQGSKIKMTIMDNAKNKVVSAKGQKGTTLTQSFRASYDGLYYIFVTQKVRGQKEVCGGISVLER